MTPKNKAKELINDFVRNARLTTETPISRYPYAIECALICVEEIIEALNPITDMHNFFWAEVKEEIDRLSWWEKLPLALATTAQSVVVGYWYYRYIDLGLWQLNIAIAIIAGLALDAIVVTTIMGRRVGRDSAWSTGASFGAFVCSALIAVDSYSTWLAPIRPLLHVSYPAMVFLYAQHLATARSAPAVIEDTTLAPVLSKRQQVAQLAAHQGLSASTIWRRVKQGSIVLEGK